MHPLRTLLRSALLIAAFAAAAPAALAGSSGSALLSAAPAPPPAPQGPRIYKLPFPGGLSFEVCQGNNHTGETHTGLAAFAWDFCMPQGSPVTAARAGVVLMVRQDSNRGGANPAFLDAANYIVVDHGDGTSALYMHLMMNGARVKPGDHVETGQLLGYSGQTGYATAPHLHFMVMTTSAADYYTQSQPVLFVDVPSDGGLPLEGKSYTSGNALLDARFFSPQGPPPFTPFWVETFRASALWSGSDSRAIRFGPAAPWQYFQVVASPSGSRLQVIVAATGAPAFVPAADVGPSGPPPSGPPNASPALKPEASPKAGVSAQATVAAGDSLFSIAAARHTTPAELVALNHLTDPNHLVVGQTLLLPAGAQAAPSPSSAAAPAPAPASSPSGGNVTVQAGETLFAIAEASHVSVDQLATLNHLSDPNQLRPGQILKLP